MIIIFFLNLFDFAKNGFRYLFSFAFFYFYLLFPSQFIKNHQHNGTKKINLLFLVTLYALFSFSFDPFLFQILTYS